MLPNRTIIHEGCNKGTWSLLTMMQQVKLQHPWSEFAVSYHLIIIILSKLQLLTIQHMTQEGMAVNIKLVNLTNTTHFMPWILINMILHWRFSGVNPFQSSICLHVDYSSMVQINFSKIHYQFTTQKIYHVIHPHSHCYHCVLSYLLI